MRVPFLWQMFDSQDPMLRILGQYLRQIGVAINEIALGVPANQTKAENLDAIWMVTQFGASLTDLIVPHQLNRAPVGLIQVEVPLEAGEALNAGKVLVKTSTTTTVTLQCTVDNKKARYLLF